MMRNKIKSDIYKRFENLTYKYKSITCETVEETNRILDLLLLEIESNEYSPQFILTRALYSNMDKPEIFESGKFVIRPSIKFLLNEVDMKHTFVLVNSVDFINRFIYSVLDWIVDYNYNIYLEDNLSRLNSYIQEIQDSTDCNWNLKFGIGDGILDISDNHIIIGLSDFSVSNLEKLGLFSSDEYWRQLYIDKFKTLLKECNRPYDIVKIKSDITNDLGIYNRKSVNKLLRKFVKRKSDCVRVGIGYMENEDSFAVVEKKAISSKDLENIDLDEVIVEDNKNATVSELKSGLDKIVISYKLMPFEKKTNAYLDIPLKEYVDICKEEEEVIDI